MTDDVAVSPLVNLRDVAETVAGVASGVLLRSEAPTTDEGRADVAWPPATVIDLREPVERPGDHPLAAVASVVQLPLLGVSPVDMQQMSEMMPRSLGDLYGRLLDPPASHRVIEAIEVIASAPTPVLIHCSGGKDRTGVLAALTLSLVGASRDDVVADYVRTADNIDSVINRLTAFFTDVMPAGMRDAVPDEMMQAPASAIESVLDRLEDVDGGVEQWFQANGGRPSTLVALRARLVPPPSLDG